MCKPYVYRIVFYTDACAYWHTDWSLIRLYTHNMQVQHMYININQELIGVHYKPIRRISRYCVLELHVNQNIVLARKINTSDYLISAITKYVFRIQHSDMYYFYSYSHLRVLYKICLFFSKHYNVRTKLFVDMTAADFPQLSHRFFLSYNLFSIIYNTRFFISIIVSNTLLNSITSLFQAANWFEREVWDLFGLIFLCNCDMRRMLTDYGLVGHPLKKDYPLSGFSEVCYDDRSKCILYTNIYLIQELRSWSTFNAQWPYYNIKCTA